MKRNWFRNSLVGLIVLVCSTAYGQGDIKDTTLLISQVNIFGAHYFPAGDYADKFFSPTMVGGGYHIKTRKNWLFGVDGGYMFRDGVRNPQTYLQNMRTESGNIIAQDGSFAPVVANMRGFAINAHIGKVFNWIGPNPNSGIFFRVGAGYLQHSIHFEARRSDLPQLENDMRPYYDQLTSGFSINQFVGYQHLSNSRLTNFYVGIEAIEGFTMNRRSFNLDLGGPDTVQKTDFLLGLKVGWIVLIYKRKPKEYYFY